MSSTQLPKGFDRFLDKYLVHCKGLTIIKESRYHLPIPSRSRCELFYVQCIMAWSQMASTGQPPEATFSSNSSRVSCFMSIHNTLLNWIVRFITALVINRLTSVSRCEYHVAQGSVGEGGGPNFVHQLFVVFCWIWFLLLWKTVFSCRPFIFGIFRKLHSTGITSLCLLI